MQASIDCPFKRVLADSLVSVGGVTPTTHSLELVGRHLQVLPDLAVDVESWTTKMWQITPAAFIECTGLQSRLWWNIPIKCEVAL
eukprot:1375523-Amphidinium_carterae.2